MTVTVTFQGPDWNPERSVKQVRARTGRVQDDEVTLTFDAFDIDYSVLTVYTNMPDDGHNYLLAERADLMNENGDECGPIGWVICPEALLLSKRPDLAEHVGKRYGRVIVTSTFAADKFFNQGTA